MKCETCGAWLMPTESGSVCSQGCGRLLPKMSRADRKMNAARLACNAPDLYRDQAGFFISESGGQQYSKASNALPELKGPPHLPAGHIIGILDSKVYEFAPREGE